MNDLIEFLTSKEIMVVYIVAAVACLLCFIIYLIDKSYYKRKRKQNTKELNKLVEEVSEKLHEEKAVENKEVSAMVIEPDKIEPVVTTDYMPVEVELPVEESKFEEKAEKPIIIQELSVEESESKPEDLVLESTIEQLEEKQDKELTEDLQYTNIEPDQKEAQDELLKLTQELEKQEQEMKNIDLTAYEEEQEENAIISLEELVKKSKEMYEANELTQYQDEGNEPISLDDLELKKQEFVSDEPVIIETIIEELEEAQKPQIQVEEIVKEESLHQEQLVLDDFNSVKVEPVREARPAYQSTTKFQRSPVISPIYGIERKETTNDIELENTANYEKLDEEIKKTNEFLMTLRELQKHLD